jgi:DNA-binding NarL/FixJ family response regulator
MQPISVLVADDDLRLRQCLRHALEIDPQLQVMWEAENGLQALVLADQHHPDVVLLDADMPRMDGFEAARCLRQRCSRVRIVIMSVYEQARSQAMEAGADAFLVKGCGCTEIRSILHRVLREGTSEELK